MAVQLRPFYEHVADPQRRVVDDSATFERLIAWLRTRRAIVVDYETSGLAWFRHARICGVGLGSWDDLGRFFAAYVPIRHRTTQPQLDAQIVLPAVGALLGDERITKVGHNLKFEDHMGRVDGISIRGPRYDTQVAAHLYDENRPTQLERRAFDDLQDKQAFHYSKQVTEQIAGFARANAMSREEYRTVYGYSELDTQFCGRYCCTDVIHTGALYSRYEQWGVSRHFGELCNTEMRLTEVLCDMECTGLPVNVEYLAGLKQTVGATKKMIEQRLWTATGGYEINPGSDNEVRALLVDVLRLGLTKMTDKEQYAVDHEVLEQFAPHSDVCQLLLHWREADKLDTTYTSSILKRLDHRNYLFADLKQCGTTTGRLSCENPNFQNFPSDSNARAIAHTGKKLKEGGIDPWSIRRAFPMRGPEWSRVFLDYSQIELRVLAYYSRDPIMVDAFLRGEDVHERTAQEVGAILGEKPERRVAKIVNFGLSYGMSASGLSKQAKISFDAAETFLAAFFARYRGVATYRKELVAMAQRNGDQWRNIFGRRRRIKGLSSQEPREVAASDRQMIASAIQGTAAELTKASLVRIYDWLRQANVPAMLCNTVHDEIQIDVPHEYVPVVVRECKALMEAYPQFAPIPILVDAEVSTQTWADKEAYEGGS